MNDFENQKAEMLGEANAAIHKAAEEFADGLKERVETLEEAIGKAERERAAQIAYDLESEAETFGWPYVTRLSRWFRKILTGDYDQKPEAEDVLFSLNSLKAMVNDPSLPDVERDKKIFETIYPKLKDVISDI